MKRKSSLEAQVCEDSSDEAGDRKAQSRKRQTTSDKSDVHAEQLRFSRAQQAPAVDIEGLTVADSGSDQQGPDVDAADMQLKTTPRKGPGRPKGSKSVGTPQKGLLGKTLFATPSKVEPASETNGTPRIERNANRSARRKSTRTLIERTILGHTSDNDDEEDEIIQHIYDSEDNEEGENEDLEHTVTAVPETPSRKRGRPKGSKKIKRSPSPVLASNLPHEIYFAQNRGGRAKTSNNNLSSLKLLDHEEFFSVSRKMEDRHAKELERLQVLYTGLFNQWFFELEQAFNICVYGFGSKQTLLMKFADYVYKLQMDHSREKIVVVNGYVPTLTIRDVLNTVAAAVAEPGYKLGSQPSEMLETLLSLLDEDESQKVTLIIHSIDRIPLRRPATQAVLSRLSSHPRVHLIASADHPSFPLLWDSSLRSIYNFLFHECTTFQPYAELDVVDEVHELLGRSGRRVGGKEGVIFVLKSLPENAKNLFRVLVAEQLAAMDGTSGEHPEDDNDDNDEGDGEQRAGLVKKGEAGVEYRVLYQKAVEEFICSNEMNLRTLLKEFHDHQMIQSKKDGLGTEYLSVPFRKEELETILEDITS